MNEPICFAQYFTNKQNVRSFSNILNTKLLKAESNKDFLLNVIGDKELVGEITPELTEILSELRENIKLYSKNDFKEFLTVKEDKERYLSSVNKDDIFTSCSRALNKIIPIKLINNNHNSKLFKKYVKVIIYSMNRQYFMSFGEMVKKWNITIAPWNSISSSSVYKILYNILHWICKTVLSAIINLNFYVTTSKTDADENKLHFFWKIQWQAFYDKKILDMVLFKRIKRFEPYCSGKKIKRKYDLQEKLSLKSIKKNTPKLHLVLKQKNEYRPIVRYRTETNNPTEKHKIKERMYFLQVLTNKKYEKIENAYQNLLMNWLSKDKPKLYFVKSDLSNAFGSINKGKLLRILCERHQQFQNSDKPSYLKTKFAENYKDMVSELRQPLLIRAGSTIYEWKEGLVQGYKYSPALSELYYTYFDKIYFSNHLRKDDNQIKLFIRVVDDYLYITDSLDDANSFLKALLNYKNVNYGKTFVNFLHPIVKFSEEITFLGYTYNTNVMEVHRASSIYSGQLCYKINFSTAISNLNQFLENRIGQTGIQINSHIFNFYHNEELVWNHIFITLCLCANKFCTILAILCDEPNMAKYMTVYKKRITVRLCNNIIATLNRHKDVIFKYCINHFQYLSFKALFLCAKETQKCSVLIPYIKVELARTNCIDGKWHEHSSRMGKNGQSQVKAMREVCRRSDLKKIMKKFDSLPEGFKCFDHKLFYK